MLFFLVSFPPPTFGAASLLSGHISRSFPARPRFFDKRLFFPFSCVEPDFLPFRQFLTPPLRSTLSNVFFRLTPFWRSGPSDVPQWCLTSGVAFSVQSRPTTSQSFSLDSRLDLFLILISLLTPSCGICPFAPQPPPPTLILLFFFLKNHPFDLIAAELI